METFQVQNVSLLEAIDAVEKALALDDTASEPDNDAAMQELQQMMMGMQ